MERNRERAASCTGRLVQGARRCGDAAAGGVEFEEDVLKGQRSATDSRGSRVPVRS